MCDNIGEMKYETMLRKHTGQALASRCLHTSSTCSKQRGHWTSLPVNFAEPQVASKMALNISPFLLLHKDCCQTGIYLDFVLIAARKRHDKISWPRLVSHTVTAAIKKACRETEPKRTDPFAVASRRREAKNVQYLQQRPYLVPLITLPALPHNSGPGSQHSLAC